MDASARDYLARIVAFHIVNRDTVTVNDRELNVYRDARLYATIGMDGDVTFMDDTLLLKRSAENAYELSYNLKECTSRKHVLTMLMKLHGWTHICEHGTWWMYPHGRRESLLRLDQLGERGRDQRHEVWRFAKSLFLDNMREEYTQQMQTTDGNGKKR